MDKMGLRQLSQELASVVSEVASYDDALNTIVTRLGRELSGRVRVFDAVHPEHGRSCVLILKETVGYCKAPALGLAIPIDADTERRFVQGGLPPLMHASRVKDAYGNDEWIDCLGLAESVWTDICLVRGERLLCVLSVDISLGDQPEGRDLALDLREYCLPLAQALDHVKTRTNLSKMARLTRLFAENGPGYPTLDALARLIRDDLKAAAVTVVLLGENGNGRGGLCTGCHRETACPLFSDADLDIFRDENVSDGEWALNVVDLFSGCRDEVPTLESPVLEECSKCMDAAHDNSEGIRNAIVASLVSHGRLVGYLRAANNYGTGLIPFPDHDLHFTKLVSPFLGAAIRSTYAMEEFKRKSSYFTQVFDAVDDLVVTADILSKENETVWQIRDANAGAHQILGYASGELAGMDARTQVYTPESADAVIKAMTFGRGNVPEIQVKAITNDGKTIPLLMSISTLPRVAGSARVTVGIGKDLARTLRYSEQLEHLVEAALDFERAQSRDDLATCMFVAIETLGLENMMISLVDREANLVKGTYVLGKSWEAIKEATVRDLGGGDILAEVCREGKPVLVPDARKDPRCNKDAILLTGMESQYITPLICGGEVIGTLQVDFTDKPQWLQEVHRKKVIDLFAALFASGLTSVDRLEEIREKETALASALDRIEQTSRLVAISEIASGIAHGAGNLMNTTNVAFMTVRDWIEDRTNESDDIRNNLATMEGALQKLCGYFDQLKGHARRKDYVFEEHEIRSRVERALLILGHRISQMKVRVRPHYSDVPKVVLSAHHLDEVLLILMGNALDAMKERGHLTIAVETTSLSRRGEESVEGVAIHITDSGSGISVEEMKKIFDDFYTTKGALGTGMGLPTARRIIEQGHGGTVEVESKGKNRGATFTVKLPISPIGDAGC